MREMLVEAYCYEDDVIENARYARRRAQHGVSDHWFCMVCHIPLVPKNSRRQNYFYSAFPGGAHAANCPHVTTVTQSGPGVPTYTIAPTPPPVYVDILGVAPPRNRRVFNPALPPNLKSLIAAAPKARIYGTLEEVVDDWQRMSPEERLISPLEVGGSRATYDQVFLNLDAQSALPAGNYWPTHIYRTMVRVTQGKILFFIESRGKFTNVTGRLPLTLRIKIDAALQAAKPNIQQQVTAGGDRLLFWNGPPPVVVTGVKGSTYALAGGNAGPAAEFAIR